MSLQHSTQVKGIESAGFDLIVQNAEHLIGYIYNHTNTRPYSDPEIRLGLVVKILLKSNTNYSRDLLQPVIDDIETLMSETEDPVRHTGLSMELSLLSKFLELDDSISLNTVQHNSVSDLMETNLLD
jgi:hypothetical protein